LQGATDADGDSLTAAVLPGTGPAHGTLSVNACDGSFTYTPAPGYYGPDSFQYVANDGTADSAPATVSLTVLEYDPNPVVAAPTTGSIYSSNQLVLRLNGPNVVLLKGSQVLFSQPLTSLNSLTIVGASAKSDALTVDFNVGGAFSIPGGVVFDCANRARGTDTLVLRGTAASDAFAALAGGFELDGVTFRAPGVKQVRLEGLGGNDTYAVSALPFPLTISDAAGVDTLDFSGASHGVNVSLATSYAQKIFGSGNTLALKGTIENLVGTNYADVLKGNSAANQIWGLDGDDTIYGGSGSDMIDGGSGNDTIYGSSGKCLLFGDAGDDRLYGGSGSSVLVGGEGNDYLAGGYHSNVQIGGLGDDTLKAGSGGDILIGGQTKYDESPAELLAILAEWTSSRSAAARVTNLTQGIGPTGEINLREGDGVLDNQALDALYGGSGADWFLCFDSNSVSNRARTDF
jgi:Ca2+-binding RTX toxin-like protein